MEKGEGRKGQKANWSIGEMGKVEVEKKFMHLWNSGILEYWNSVKFLPIISLFHHSNLPFSFSFSPLRACPEFIEG